MNWLKKSVRSVFSAIDVTLGLFALFAVLPFILIAMQIHRIKQWSEDYEDS